MWHSDNLSNGDIESIDFLGATVGFLFTFVFFMFFLYFRRSKPASLSFLPNSHLKFTGGLATRRSLQVKIYWVKVFMAACPGAAAAFLPGVFLWQLMSDDARNMGYHYQLYCNHVIRWMGNAYCKTQQTQTLIQLNFTQTNTTPHTVEML